MKKVSLLAAFLLFGTLAYSQSNTCAYTFTFPEHSFQFCLTSVGTLALLQSPIGVNHLDTENPVEGWTWELAGTVHRPGGGGDVFFDGSNVPARGSSFLPAPTVTQPNGPGTLPIKFEWQGEGNGMWEIVTAQPEQKSIVMKVGIPARGVFYLGNLTRLITLRLDGKSLNKFRHLRTGAFAYVDKGEALLMESPGSLVCFGPGEIWASFQCSAAAFNGYGTLLASGTWEVRSKTSLAVTYKIF
jgi:hypothetical protein